jgi:hypothetical protein
MGDFGVTEGVDPRAGEWRAIIVDGGDSFTLDDIDGNGSDPGDVRVCVVHGTAIPVGGTLPRDYDPDDMLVEFEGFVALDQIEQRWAQAVAMAAGLNAAAAGTLVGRLFDGLPGTRKLFYEAAGGTDPAGAAGDRRTVSSVKVTEVLAAAGRAARERPQHPTYPWAEVMGRTGYEASELLDRLGLLHAVGMLQAPDGTATQGALDRLLRLAEIEGDVHATAEAGAYRSAATLARGRPGGGALADDLDKLAEAAEQDITAGRATARPVTWADVAAGTDLTVEETHILTKVLSTLTADGRPTQATVDIIRGLDDKATGDQPEAG